MERARDLGGDRDISAESLKHQALVGIIDCGGQYTQLVQKACERQGFHAKFFDHDVPAEELEGCDALIIAGSPGNAFEDEAPLPDAAIWQSGKPTLGICFGMHAMAAQLGGDLQKGEKREDGRVTTTVDINHPFFKTTKPQTTALFTHGNFVTEVPDGFKVIGNHEIELDDGSKQKVISAMAKDNMVGVQFHPEVFDDSPDGYAMFNAFLKDVAGLQPDEEFLAKRTEILIDELTASIVEKVGDNEVIAFVSGGVDSSVATALALKALPKEKIHAIYIDNGYMRDEDEAVIDLLSHLGVDIQKIDATEMFEQATIELEDGTISPPLIDVSDPELKRHIIGKTFIDISKKIKDEKGFKNAILLQGTNAADRVESGHGKGKSTAVIKTHHNQVKEAKELDDAGLLCEPLTDLFKDEIRNVGRSLGLPDEVVERQPYPGPGLAIRILCAVGNEFQEQSDVLNNEVRTWVNSALMARSTLLPVRNVGVGGDERSHLAVLAVDKQDDWQAIQSFSAEATATFKEHINRVVCRVAGQWSEAPYITPTKLDAEARSLLRQADRVVFEQMRKFGVITDISQMPVVLLPIGFGGESQRSVVLRPIKTLTFMTSQAMLPELDLPDDFITSCGAKIIDEVPGISTVFLDCTNKPPATTEWE